MTDRITSAAEKDVTPEVVLHRVWGTASDVREDGFVNPSSVNYAPSEASAIKLAAIRDEVPVTTLVADWQVIPPAVTEGGDPS